MQSDILWAPDPSAFDTSNLAKFAKLNGHGPDDYAALHAWSIAEKGAFWSALWDFAGVIGDKGDATFVQNEASWMKGARFFPDARLNLAENLLRGSDEATAIVASDETGALVSTTHAELRRMVARAAEGLRVAGVRPGDRVAGVMGNTLEALVALLASATVGAIWSSCSPDFGAAAIVDRLGQIAPKVLFATPVYRYGGREHEITERLAEVVEGIDAIETVVLSGTKTELALPRGITSVAQAEFGAEATLRFERVPFDHPVYILYTSGTTGAPKAIVHRSGGVLLQHLKEHQLHGDVRSGDVLLWYTNIAWMMYHWIISGLGCGATVVLYDGASILKAGGGLDCSPLWSIVERTGVTHLGVSPKYLATLAAEGYRPGDRHDLAKLRALLSAGAPVTPAQFDWVYDAVKRDMMFASISGGTEILGCFLIGSPLHPVRRGQLTVKALGHAVNVIDERGAPVVGRRGDLVCTEPFPSMPLTFWGEGGDSRYHATYFAERPEIWSHGDVAELTIHGGGIVHGRSDNTLKPGGVRIGTAEIYAAVEAFPQVEDCLVFGAIHEGDEEVVLCIKPKPDAQINVTCIAEIRAAIRAQASPRHVPQRVHIVRDIPYTINGKRVEGAARAVLAGGQVKNLGSLANPQCLDEFRALDRSAAL
jgi:acetoacetyl-CoA synthetase